MPAGAELSSAALRWLTGAITMMDESSRSEQLSCYIRNQVIELLRLWLIGGDQLRSALEDPELLARMSEFVSETEHIDSGVRTDEEHAIVESIRDWWASLAGRILASTRLCSEPSLGQAFSRDDDRSSSVTDPAYLDVDLDSPPSNAEKLLSILAGIGEASTCNITATVCIVLLI